MPYTAYEDRLSHGRPGDPFDEACSADDISRIAAAPQATQKETITVATVAASTAYTFTVNGVVVSYTSAASGATKESIARGLEAALEADPALSGVVLASFSSPDKLVLTSIKAGLGFTFSESDANLTSAATTANAAAAAIPFGRAVAEDSGNAQSMKLIDGAAITGNSAVFTPTVANTALYQIVFKVDGEVYTISYTSDGSATAQEIVEGLDAAFTALSPAPVNITSSEDDATYTLAAANGSDVQIEQMTSNLTMAFTPGDSIADVMLGILRRAEEYDPDETGGVDGVPPNRTGTVRRTGRMRVTTEESCAPGDPVYVRTLADGAFTDVGVFRKTAATGAVLLPGASWYKNETGSLAIVQR